MAPTTQTPEHPSSLALTAFWWLTMLINCAMEAAPPPPDRLENCQRNAQGIIRCAKSRVPTCQGAQRVRDVGANHVLDLVESQPA